MFSRPYNNCLRSSSFGASPSMLADSYTMPNSLQKQENFQQLDADSQIPPPSTFKTEYHGVLSGVQGLLNMLYAATGIFNYGGMFVKVSYKVVKFIALGLVRILPTVTGYNLMKKILTLVAKLAIPSALLGERFIEQAWRVSESAVGKLQSIGGSSASGAVLSKAMFIARMTFFAGAAIVYLLRKKVERDI